MLLCRDGEIRDKPIGREVDLFENVVLIGVFREGKDMESNLMVVVGGQKVHDVPRFK